MIKIFHYLDLKNDEKYKEAMNEIEKTFKELGILHLKHRYKEYTTFILQDANRGLYVHVTNWKTMSSCKITTYDMLQIKIANDFTGIEAKSGTLVRNRKFYASGKDIIKYIADANCEIRDIELNNAFGILIINLTCAKIVINFFRNSINYNYA